MNNAPNLITGIPLNVRGERWTIRTHAGPLLDGQRVRCQVCADAGRRTVWIDPDAPASRHAYLIALAAGEAFKAAARHRRRERRRRRARAVTPAEDVGAAMEALAPGERVSDREFLEAAWRAVSPDPLPPGLPADSRLVVYTGPGFANARPHLFSGAGERQREHCPCCGKAYVMASVLGRHLQKKHGWARRDGLNLMPPVSGSEAT